MTRILWNSILFFTISFLALTSLANNLSAEKEWTFLIFLNGHNNLSSFGEMNLKDMEKVGSSEEVNIVVEWGQAENPLTQRLLVQKSTNPKKITSPILMSLKDHDMGDYKNLVDFVKWGIDNFPAKHYFVAVWNHGSGWHLQKINSQKKSSIGINNISYDDNTGNEITTEQLAVAMDDIKNYLGKKIDIYGSDACLMQMLEVATEMKNSVDYIVGSEELEPGEGWPYETFLRKWVKAPKSNAAEISRLLSKEYLAAYSDGGVYGEADVTFSALDISKLDQVLKSAEEVSIQLQKMGPESMEKVKAALRKVQFYFYSDYKDYGHLLKTMETLVLEVDKSVFARALSDMNALVLTKNNSLSYKNSSGVSVWLPMSPNENLTRYQNLEFDKLTGWSHFFERVRKK